jgi:hypothetical protein
MMIDVEKILARGLRRGRCLLWPGACYPNGYGKLSREKGKRRKGAKRRRSTHLVHREVYRALRGKIPAAHLVIHTKRCSGDHACIEPVHLIAVKPTQKMREWVKRKTRRGRR